MTHVIVSESRSNWEIFMTFLKTIYAASAAITVSLGSACTANSAEVQVAQATNYLKPGASVTYSHNLKSQLSAGESTIFNLSLSESYPNGTLKVSLRSEGDIDLFASSTQAEFDLSLIHISEPTRPY